MTPAAALLLLSTGLVSFAFPARAADPTADYTVVFDSTWSEQTHPGTLPPGPHFSGLIGGLHNDQVIFWQSGALASQGIEDMAELGSKSQLTNEVNTAIGDGTAGVVLSGGDIPTSPGMVSLSFTAQQAYPLLTLVSMLAPSPDWFVGVASLELMSAGEWRRQIVVPLYVWDAGTDSGPTFTASDDDTNPADPITRFETGVFAPPMQFVGTFTITRTDAPPTPVPAFDRTGPQLLLLFTLAGLGLFLIGARDRRSA